MVDVANLGSTPSATPLAPRDAGVANKDKNDKDDAKDPPPTPSAPPAASAATPPPGAPGDLAEEMRKRVGGAASSDAPTKDAEKEGPAANQSKPSNGAVAGALGAVRGAAKACVEDLEGVTRVNVVFKSDGSVASVSVSGVAAGKSAEACVRAAVMKAKVAPFTDPTYSASFTIRNLGSWVENLDAAP